MTGSGLEVSIDVEASEEEVEAVAAAFRDAGIDASVSPTYGRKSLGTELPWIVLIGLPLKGFLTAFGEEAGRDAWAALKSLVTKIRDARNSDNGSIVVQSRESPTTLVISKELPDAGYVALFNLDSEASEGAYLLWDEERGEWKDGTSGA